MRFKDTFIFLVVAVVVLAFSATVQADILDVCKSGCTYSTINNAIDAANADDTVQINDSEVYSENVVIEGLGITLKSTTGNAEINGGGSNPSVSIVNITSGNAVLDGLTITNGYAIDGGGIYVYYSSPSITNCVVENNTATNQGGGIYFYESPSSSITNCIIEDNTNEGLRATEHSHNLIVTDSTINNNTGTYAASFYRSSYSIFTRCTINNNSSAIRQHYSAYSKFINCLFAKNAGYALYFDQNTSDSSIVNCTLSANLGKPIFYRNVSGGGHSIINSIVWGNTKRIFNNSSLTVTYSDIQGGFEGEGNIDDDPLFSAPQDDDFSLRCASPAKDSGDDSFVYDPDLAGQNRSVGNAIDMGAYEYQSTASCPTPSTITVGNSGDYSTIQAAIDAAKDDDTILVYTGTYEENIDFKGKDIKVISEDEERPEYTIIDGGGSGNVVTMANYEGLGAQLSGFTIMDGSLTNGGGISLANFASPSISNCIITSNTGNGIYMDHSYANITNSVITDNTNAGIEATISNLTISNSFISENNYSGIYASGDSDQHLSFSNCTIENNSSSYFGGGLRINTSYPTLENCTIKNNTTSAYGGGIYFKGTSPYISNCIIDNNLSSQGGAGVFADGGSNSQFINCLITRNTGGNDGSGINFDESTPNSSLINSTVSDNMGATSSIFYRNVSGGGHLILDSIVWGNEKGILNNSSLTVTYSDIQSGWTGTGNIDLDPDFVNSAAGDYHLNSSSPCIDAGTCDEPAAIIDLDGNPRPIGDGCDMGAYEYTEITSDYCIISGYVMDYSDNPISSATVNLKEYNGQGTLLGTTTSNSDGYYEFNSLANRIYVIEGKDGTLLNRRTGKANKSLPWAQEEFINLYLNE